MADLDDFFAKKDRKKKTTKKFTTTEEVAKKLEDTAKKTEKQKKERAPDGDENSTPGHEQDEWKEFEEEKKDYTGLKIGHLSTNVNQESNSVSQEAGSTDQPEGGDTGVDLDRKAGPWKRIDVVSEAVTEDATPPPRAEPPKETQSEGPSKYKAPGLRYQSQQGNSAPSRLRFNRGGVMPDIHNEDYFPTLSKSGDNKKTRGEGSFEVVQQHRSSSYRQHLEQSRGSSGPQLNLGNRYNTLSNDS